MLQEKIISRREAEYSQMKRERDERVSQLIAARKLDRETRRKLVFFLKSEEERLARQRKEEEARKLEGLSLLWRFKRQQECRLML